MSGAPPPPALATGESQQEDHALLFARLRSQVEFYFSPQNLARDTYLRNTLSSEHPDMPSPRPAALMCPLGVITNFPKVRDICAQFGEGAEPPALLLAKALGGSSVVAVPPDGNWIGPTLQSLPPPMMGGPPPRGSHGQPSFQQPHPFQPGFQPGPFPANHGMHQQPMQMMPPHQPGMPYPPQGQPPNITPITGGGSESPSSASLQSMPSQHQAQQTTLKGGTFVAVMDLPSEVNPIAILLAFTTEAIRPKSAFLDSATSTWFVAFESEADAKAALEAGSEMTISGAPIRAQLNSELPPSSKVSVASASAASLSSMSGQGGQIAQQQQQPGPPMGQHPGAYPHPQGPSPPPPMMAQPVMQPYPPVGGPQYAMPPPMQMPPGQPYPPYYSPQQMYPGSYMQPQPQGGLQQPQMPPYPPQMGTRFGVGGIPPPPPPPRGYPGGPPPPYPQYQGMPHYMGDGYGGPYGLPPPHRQLNDRRQGGPAALGGYHDHKKKNDANKKKKNKSNQQQRRDSYGSGSADNNNVGPRRHHEYNNYGGNYQQQHLRNDNSTSPVPGDNRNKWKKRGEYGDQFKRGHGYSSPSFNRHYDRHPNDRLSSSDTTPASLSSGQVKADDNREIFTSSDFPGLRGKTGGDESDKASLEGNKSDGNGEGNKQQLIGYANALLKKKDHDRKNEADLAPTAAADNDVDSITRQTEAMEREILSEFHDLSIIGEGKNDTPSSPPHAQNQQEPDDVIDDKIEGQTEATASSSTIDARSVPNSNPLPILPGPFPDNDSQENLSESPMLQQPPAIDVTSPQDFPDSEATKNAVDDVLPSPITSSPPSVDNEGEVQVDEKQKQPGAWGRRFADVI